MATIHDVEAVGRALKAGQITVLDPATGYHRSMYANCPADGTLSGVYMVTRHAGAITEVTFRCSVCARHFTARPEEIHLR